VTVLGGYLGAGKTSLLNHLLRHNAGRRLAVIVNDFGSINIDVALVESQEGDTFSLANGCICCTLGDDLAMTMTALLKRTAPPEQIIIEASGVADPVRIAHYGTMPGYRLDAIVVLADAETVRQRSQDRYIGATVHHQLLGAELIVMNKVDLVSPATCQAVRQWLGIVAPGARIVEAVCGAIPLALLLDLSLDRMAVTTDVVGDRLVDHRSSYETWSFAKDGSLDGARLRALVEQLPEGILRGKGILTLSDAPTTRTIFQLVGRRWSLKQGEPWDDALPSSQVVLIGLPGSIDAAAFEQALQ